MPTEISHPEHNLLERLEFDLNEYMQKHVRGMIFYQLVKYHIAPDFEKASMDRDKSLHFYRGDDNGLSVSVFTRAMHQARTFYDRNVSLVSKLYTENKEKKNIIAKYVPGENTFSYLEDIGRHALVYEFASRDCNGPRGQEEVESSYTNMTLGVLFSKMESILSHTQKFPDIQSFNVLTPKAPSPSDDTFREMLYYGLAQNSPLFEYCFINPSHQIHGNIIGDGVLVIFCHQELEDEVYTGIESRFSRWSANLSIQSLQLLMRKANTKSAIGSIMSRNGSHNIGSHVLAALSHNVGTMPDDRVLYQYIQHRMDYIATVTTDIPTWTQPTMLVGELMRDFYSQRHLLEHIAESEGLSAWEFQNPNLTEEAAKTQHGKIKLLTRCKRNGCFTPMVHYEKDRGGVDLLHDVSLAIPGGVVGKHAFYTILENIVRNAAKHGWSSKPLQERQTLNLEVTIDFEDKGNQVEFTVWDNMSDLGEKDVGNLYWGADGKFHEPETMAEVTEATPNIPLHWRQQLRVAKSLIAEDGHLRRENWGMAEIKISAGYLMGRSISTIGGLVRPKEGPFDSQRFIVAPCAVKDDHGAFRLGYRFCVRKPKELVFVLGDAQKSLWKAIGEQRRELFSRQGIEFVDWSEAKNTPNRETFAARHVVMPQFGLDEMIHVNLPFRVLVWDGGENSCSELVPKLDLAKIEAALKESDAQIAKELRRVVATTWLEHLRSKSDDERVKQSGLALVVNTVGDDLRAGRGLITDDDLLEFVFKHGLRTAIETFVDVRGGNLPDDLKDVLLMLHALYPGNGKFEKHPEVEDLLTKIAWALLARIQAVEESLSSSQTLAALEASRHRLHFDKGDSQLGERLEAAKDYLRCRYGRPSRKDYERLRHWREHPHPLKDFILHLRCVFKETDVFLRKYEERIATLPAGYSLASDGVGNSASPTTGWFGFVDLYPRKPQENLAKAVANYTRHDKPGKERPGGMVYHEPLSGTQSYLNSLMRFSCDGPEKTPGGDILLEKLTENALLKVCIADERMSKFLRDHQTVRDTYNAENILVLDEKWVESCLNLDQDPAGFNSPDPDTGLHRPATDILRRIRDYVRDNGQLTAGSLDGAWVRKQIEGWRPPSGIDEFWQKGKTFDILVLHQGLIDKWLGEAAHSKSHVAVFLELLKQYAKYVVITTGRGTPANIPPGARVLPFPTLESTLFKMYPEKMVLVDTIMNILPATQRAETNGDNE